MAHLSVIIVGAGIAGLSAAIALRKQGHSVTLLEKSSFHQEAGAAIHVSPNCTRLLRRLGLDAEAHGGNACTGFAKYDSAGASKHRVDMRTFLQGFDSPFDLIHRADLHGALKQLALDEAGDGPVPKLVLGCRITNVDAAAAFVSLQDGNTFSGDVVLGADGAHSLCRAKVDSSIRPFSYGKSCYRFIVPRRVLLNDQDTAPLIDSEGWFEELSEGDKRIVMYPCRDNTAMNIAAFVPNAEVAAEGEGYNKSGSRDELIQSFSCFTPGARKLVSYADEDVKVWELYDMASLPTWTRDRLALIGDAAHPFLPFLGQGGAMAIEDAVCIARLLPSDTPKSAIADRLKLFESIRYERVEYVRDETRRNGQDEDKRSTDMVAMMKYCYGHDEWTNTERILRNAELAGQ